MSFAFLSLPREIRDIILKLCLDSDEILELKNLQFERRGRLQLRPHYLGLFPNILRVCRQLNEEASQLLYGANTFFLDIQPMWQYTRDQAICGLLEEEICSQHPYTCLLCSKKIQGLTSTEAAEPNTIQSAESPTKVCRWSSGIEYIRRLQLSLRPYTYQQYHDVYAIKFYLQKFSNKKDRKLIHNCLHSLKDALPPGLQLDMLILHIARPAVALPTDQKSLVSAMRYLIDAEAWRSDVQRDMNRDISQLLTFARRSTKVLVLPNTGSAQGIPFTGNFDNSTLEIFTKVPGRFLRTGSLARMKSRKPNSVKRDPDPSWLAHIREHDKDTATEIYNHACENNELVMLGAGPDTVFDSL